MEQVSFKIVRMRRRSGAKLTDEKREEVRGERGEMRGERREGTAERSRKEINDEERAGTDGIEEIENREISKSRRPPCLSLVLSYSL